MGRVRLFAGAGLVTLPFCCVYSCMSLVMCVSCDVAILLCEIVYESLVCVCRVTLPFWCVLLICVSSCVCRVRCHSAVRRHVYAS